jgi:hypothetical protein
LQSYSTTQKLRLIFFVVNSVKNNLSAFALQGKKLRIVALLAKYYSNLNLTPSSKWSKPKVVDAVQHSPFDCSILNNPGVAA